MLCQEKNSQLKRQEKKAKEQESFLCFSSVGEKSEIHPCIALHSRLFCNLYLLDALQH
jgi:hypothetical protein